MKRRSFFKLAGISAAAFAAGAALPACTASPNLTPTENSSSKEGATVSVGIPIDFTAEVDALIIGSGIAGLSAAMNPSEAGCSVIIAEMLDLVGGESYHANGLICTTGTEIQKQAGISTSLDDAWEDLQSKYKEDKLDENLEFEKALFEGGSEWVDRIISDYGAGFTDPKEYTDKGSPSTFLLPKAGLGDMSDIMGPLRDKLVAQGVSFMLGMRAFFFILNEDSIPVGIRFYLDKTNTVSDIKAKKIVFATGGFIGNQELVHTYLPKQEALACYTTYADGGGHRLATTIQGQLSGMDKVAPPTSDLPQVETWGLFGPVIDISPEGKRLAAEDKLGASALACFEQELGFWWTIFNGKLSDNGQSKSVSYIKGKHPKRMLGPFDTIEALASAINTSSDTLKESFATYQKSCDAGKDEAFGKECFLEKIDPPYYAVRQFPNRFRSFGGVATDENAQMLDVNGQPIANVYYCGACAAGSYTGLASHAAYGVIAGRSLVAAIKSDQDSSDSANDSSLDAKAATEADESIDSISGAEETMTDEQSEASTGQETTQPETQNAGE